MPEFIAKQDCVITGHAGIVRKGARIQLSRRAAKYPRLKGWIEPAPAKGVDAIRDAVLDTKTPASPRRQPKKA